MNYKETIIQNIKDCGQSLIDNAENIVGDYKYARGFMINCFVDVVNEAPYISVDVDFYPEHFIERLNTNNKDKDYNKEWKKMKLTDYLKEQLKYSEFRKEYEAFKSFILPTKTKFTLANSESDNQEALSDKIDMPELKDM